MAADLELVFSGVLVFVPVCALCVAVGLGPVYAVNGAMYALGGVWQLLSSRYTLFLLGMLAADVFLVALLTCGVCVRVLPSTMRWCMQLLSSLIFSTITTHATAGPTSPAVLAFAHSTIWVSCLVFCVGGSAISHSLRAVASTAAAVVTAD